MATDDQGLKVEDAPLTFNLQPSAGASGLSLRSLQRLPVPVHAKAGVLNARLSAHFPEPQVRDAAGGRLLPDRLVARARAAGDRHVVRIPLPLPRVVRG